MTPVRIPVDMLKIGDGLISDDGREHKVSSFEPHRDLASRRTGRIVHCEDGLTLTVFDGDMVRVAS